MDSLDYWLANLILVIRCLQLMFLRPLVNPLEISTFMPSVEVGIDPKRPSGVSFDEIGGHIRGALKMYPQAVNAVVHVL